MKKRLILILSAILLLSTLTSCSSEKKTTDKVVIFSSAEDYRNEYMQQRLAEEFPEYEVVIEYMTTGNHAAKLLSEGINTECDISFDLEYGYLEKLNENFASVDSFDRSAFVDDVIIDNANYLPDLRNSGAIVVNEKALKEKHLPLPTSYKDLTDEKYRSLICIPNPKSSGTGYMFVKGLVNLWGEDEAFQFFDDLSANVLQYTSSGSGPVNALVQGEALISLAMTSQAVTEINRGADLKIIKPEEGMPYSLYGYAIIKGKENRKAVMDVFNFLYTTYTHESNALYYPERIFKDIDNTKNLENYPHDIPYMDMHGDTIAEKERLLKLWEH